MTKGVSDYPQYAQVFLCKRRKISLAPTERYFLLDAKKTSPTYKMSKFGKSIVGQLRVPKCQYIAKVNCQLELRISNDIFLDLNSDYFPVWIPEAPISYFKGLLTGFLIIFEVYEITEPINPILLEKGRRGRNSIFGLYDTEGNAVEVITDIKNSVLKDDEFRIIKQDIIHRLDSFDALIKIIN